MITVINCFLAVNKQGYEEGEALSADIGSEAINRDYDDDGYTNVNSENPCNVNGRITSIEIWAATDLTGCKVASFKIIKDGTFGKKYLTTRDFVSIGNVTAGSKQTFPVDLLVRKGDLIGIYSETGSIEYGDNEEDVGHVYYLSGDYISCENILFSRDTNASASVYGTGISVTPKTYTSIDDCSLHVNANDENFFGRIIDCSLTVQRVLVGACLATAQSIRLKITIDGEDVSNALVGQVMIQHNENLISLFSFNLNDFQYSPLLVGDYEDKEVVITSYVNGQEVKLFTGLIDGTRSDAGGKYNLYIYGSGYGKKLLKRMTLISVQEAATAKTRGAIIRYLANQAGITDIEVPTGSTTVIDHSFQDQFVFDMIKKECMIEGWVMREDENGKIIIYEKVIKTNETLYPTPDWEYGENKFILLGLDTTREGIINQLTILGAIFEEEVITINEIDVPPYEPVYDEQTTTINKSFSSGEVVTNWSYEDDNFKVKTSYLGWTKQPGFPFNPYQDYSFSITKLNSDLTVADVEWTVTSNVHIYKENNSGCRLHRETFMVGDMAFQEGAFTITIKIKTKEQTDGGKEQYEEENPTEEVVSTIIRTQIKAVVNDPVSIAKYGVKKPPGEGSEEYPLAETEAQCISIGQRRIRDSHRYTKQPDYSVNFNPRIVVGEVVKLTDNKIGYNQRWRIEENVLIFDIDPETGAIKPRTRIGCVFYA